MTQAKVFTVTTNGVSKQVAMPTGDSVHPHWWMKAMAMVEYATNMYDENGYAGDRFVCVFYREEMDGQWLSIDEDTFTKDNNARGDYPLKLEITFPSMFFVEEDGTRLTEAQYEEKLLQSIS